MNVKLISGLAAATGILILGIVIGRVTGSNSPVGLTAENEGALNPDKKSSQRKRTVSSISPSGLFQTFQTGGIEKMVREVAESTVLGSIEDEALLRISFMEWARRSPIAALDFARESKHSHSLIHLGLVQMAQQRPEDALDWVKQHAENERQARQYTMSVYQGMAQTNPSQAVAGVEQMPQGAMRDDLLAITVNEWAKKDVYAAFDWIETAPATPQLDYIYHQVMASYIQNDPNQAASLVADMESGSTKANFAAQIAAKLAEQDIDQALRWTQTLDGSSNSNATLVVMDRWASGPQAMDALNYTLENPDHPHFKAMLSTIATHMSYSHPDQMAAAMSRLTDEAEQVLIAQQVASSYSVNSPDKLKQWVSSMQPGPVRDSALTSALSSSMDITVAEVFELSEKISDESLMAQQMSRIVSRWMAVDPDGVERALNASPVLSASQKKAFLDEAQNVEFTEIVLPSKN